MVNKTKSRHKKRFYDSLSRKGYDRLPVKHFGEPVVNKEIAAYLGLDNQDTGSNVANPSNVSIDLLESLGDDFRYVLPAYTGPGVKYYQDGTRTAVFPERGWPIQAIKWVEKKISSGEASYLEVAHKPFNDINDPRELEKFEFPSADWFDYSKIEAEIEEFSDYVICIDKAGPSFIGNISYGRGLDNVFMDIATKNPVYIKLMEIAFEYRYELTRRTLEAGKGKIDVVHFSEDMSSQLAPFISIDQFKDLFAGFYKEIFELAHRYNAKAMLHSCGSVYSFIPNLIEIGLDILDVVQTSAKNMEIGKLSREFGKDICFCGTMDVQQVLINMTPKQVEEEVKLRQRLFPDGGLILGPSHAIQPGTPMENIIAMYRTAGSLEGI